MALPALTLRALTATPVDVPMRRPLGTSARTIDRASLLLVDLATEEGPTGHAYAFCYLPSIARGLVPIVAELGESLTGLPLNPVDIAQRMKRHFKLPGLAGPLTMVASSVDTAAWGAMATAAGVPLATLLGAAPRPMPAYNSNGLGIMSPEAAADEAEALLEGGFRAVKLRLGRGAFEKDLAVVRAVRRRLPASIHLMVDFNQALAPADASWQCQALDDEGLYWIEEPTRHDDYAQLARIAAAVRTPIQIGENFTGLEPMAAALAVQACDLVMPDLDRIGGVTGWQRAAGLAEAHHCLVSSHLFPEVSAHLLMATPGAHWLEYVDWAEPLLAEPLRIVDGMAVLPSTPGNGIAWDPAAVARYRLS